MSYGLDMNPSLRVLVIEDENDIREFLMSQLADSGMRVEGLPSGENLLRLMENFRPDVILMDQMMPGRSGRDLIQDLRSNVNYSEVPIMMVTGLDSEGEKITSFGVGADDYITKPFSIREVIARIQALVRRSQASHRATQKNIVVKDLHVDLVAHRVTLQGKVVPLTLTEFKILVELLKQAGQVLSRDRLRERALGNLNVTDRTIDVHMASLRKKLETMGDAIETVRGVGYRLTP